MELAEERTGTEGFIPEMKVGESSLVGRKQARQEASTFSVLTFSVQNVVRTEMKYEVKLARSRSRRRKISA